MQTCKTRSLHALVLGQATTVFFCLSWEKRCELYFRDKAPQRAISAHGSCRNRWTRLKNAHGTRRHSRTRRCRSGRSHINTRANHHIRIWHLPLRLPQSQMQRRWQHRVRPAPHTCGHLPRTLAPACTCVHDLASMSMAFPYFFYRAPAEARHAWKPLFDLFLQMLCHRGPGRIHRAIRHSWPMCRTTFQLRFQL